MRVHVERLTTLSAVDAAAWNTLAGDSPFLKHEFLRALEASGCVGHGTTWQPCYIVARDEQGLAGALPLFIKYDSHGEFVFDWGWADAYERGGRNYYPKLVAAIPFTPATGQRLLLRDGLETGVATLLLDAARSTALEIGASSLHVLFPTEPERQTLERAGFLARKGCQFHWTNGGYQKLRRVPCPLQRRQAQESQTRASKSGGGRHRVRAPARRRADRRRLGRDHANSIRERSGAAAASRT